VWSAVVAAGGLDGLLVLIVHAPALLISDLFNCQLIKALEVTEVRHLKICTFEFGA